MPGPGGASPVVWKDHVFVSSVDEADGGLRLLCLKDDGTLKWQKKLKGKNLSVRMDSANSASASPCTDGQHVWVTTSAGFLECFDLDGNEIWSVDLQDRYGEFQIQFGMSSTPVLHDGVLYLQLIHGSMRDRSTTSEGTVVALEAATGKEVWKQSRSTDGHTENKHSYASPTLVMDGDTEYLVTHGGDYVMGHSLKDGQEIWRMGGLNPKDNYNPYLRFVASPVAAEGKLIVPSAKNGPVICLETNLTGDVTEDAEATQWVLRQGTPDVATPVVHDGLVFLARENGVMLCVDAETGEEVYQRRMFADKHRSTPVYADGKLYIVARDGTVVVLSADRQGTVLAENELGDVGKASPAIVDGKIYIRTSKALYCFANE
jgi:outer membrane protein assembly factor BamB